ncbi:LLM class flavin-dependent oxidoreductase [Sphingobium fuliginis]|nr:LLM class flavin-dependent oxidoreductase [Sphingobium fuliginis]
MHPAGQHVAAWRHSSGYPDAAFSMDYYRQIATIAEAARFDFLFVADMMGIRDGSMNVIVRSAQLTLGAEPLTLMAALSAMTQNIGFIVTQSTTYSQPYSVARQMASLDLLSGGRAAWNVVTSTQMNEAANFGLTQTIDHSVRYERAKEFVEVVKALWDTAGVGVFIGDKPSGILFDSEKLRPLHHKGPFYTVDGILNVPPSAQGRPVLVQAGASGPGRDLAASIAEIIFAQTPTIEAAQEYYADVKMRVRDKGRDPCKVLMMPGFTPVIGCNRAEAEAQLAELDAMITPEIAVPMLSDMMGMDLSAYDIDGPLPELEETNKSHSLGQVIKSYAERNNLNIRQTAAWSASSMSHNRVIGTPKEIADRMQYWFENQACDGFLISPLIYPGGLKQFADEVVPILQERKLFRQEYEGNTLRENLGLAGS